METMLDSVLRWQVVCIVLLAVLCLVLVGTNIVLVWLLWKRRTFTEFHYRLAPASTATTGSSASYTVMSTPMPGLPDAGVVWRVDEKAEPEPEPKPPKPKAKSRRLQEPEAPAAAQAVGETGVAYLCPKCQVQMAVDHLETSGKDSQAVYQCPKCGQQQKGPVT